MLRAMNAELPPHLTAVFHPTADAPVRAALVAGACGNVGFGKAGQFLRLLSKYDIPVIALDLSPSVKDVPEKLRAAFAKKFSPEQIDAMLEKLVVVQGTLDDVPATLPLGFVFEAIPERLDIKRPFYEAIRARDPEAYVFSATSGITTQKLFKGIAGADRSGVLHPFFPHLTNKLWELPVRGATTSAETQKVIGKMFGALGMSPLAVADVPAFAADRLFCGMMLEAVRIHVDTGLSPAQIDDACKKLLGTSPFFVHNLIPGANYLSAHCMELMTEEVDSTLFAIPDAWVPFTKDPKMQWPYTRGERCPADMMDTVRTRMYGMLFALTAYMLEHDVAGHDALNFLCEQALAFRLGVPALIQLLGTEEATSITRRFLDQQQITKADEVAPLGALDTTKPGWGNLYVSTSCHNGVGLLSLKRTTLNHVFVAELDAAYDTLANDDSVKSMVLAPDGTFAREFGHGADPNCFVEVLGNHERALALINGWKAPLAKLRQGKPTVAALVGRVLGGGLEFASSCHARVAANGTRLGQPETTVGVIPGLGGCHLIHRQSSPDASARINELLLTGHGFTAEEAAEWGFVSKLVKVRDLPKESMAFAAGLAEGSIPMPAFRSDAAAVKVQADVTTTNEAGVPLDAKLRELLAETITAANGVDAADGSAIEGTNAATSLTMSSSAIGVKAMMRGKPPAFEHPLEG